MKKPWFVLCLSLLLAASIPAIDLSKLTKVKKGAEMVSGATHKITEEEEYYIGRAVAANILSQYPLWKDKSLSRYLNLIGKALAFKSERPEIFGGYHFALLDSDEANALSAPGGIIFVSRGIIALAANEDELAAILAHEIQHIVSRDPLQAIQSQRMKALGTFAAGEAMGSSGDVLSIFKDSVLDITGTLLQKGYSRGQEKDADLGALDLLVATGYDPRALLAMLEKCRALEKKKAKAFSAHPSAAKRIAYVSDALGKAAGRDTGARDARFKKSVPR
ncbi:MAG TPA: M48 family metalloprotease [Candidatus Binatia bacterium]|nr:M48 family metalloprotease [Candidatus Binatia bacterium]